MLSARRVKSVQNTRFSRETQHPRFSACAFGALACIGPVIAVATAVRAATGAADQLPAEERLFAAARLYNQITTYFAHWGPLSRTQFDTAYREYLAAIAASERMSRADRNERTQFAPGQLVQ